LATGTLSALLGATENRWLRGRVLLSLFLLGNLTNDVIYIRITDGRLNHMAMKYEYIQREEKDNDLREL